MVYKTTYNWGGHPASFSARNQKRESCANFSHLLVDGQLFTAWNTPYWDDSTPHYIYMFICIYMYIIIFIFIYVWAFPLPFENGVLQHGISSKSSTHVPSIKIKIPAWKERQQTRQCTRPRSPAWRGSPVVTMVIWWWFNQQIWINWDLFMIWRFPKMRDPRVTMGFNTKMV